MGLIKGMPYPIIKHAKGYLHNTSDEIDQIKSDILSIVLTKPGERVCEPTFGTSLDKISNKQPLPVKVQQTRRMIASAIKKWEPRVQLKDVKIETHDNHIISFEIIFINPLFLQKTESVTVQLG